MITLQTNLKNLGTSQPFGFDFNSYCRFGDISLACGQSGISTVNVDGAVASLFETFVTDFQWAGKNRNRYIYLGVETDGTIIVTPIVDKKDGKPITFTPKDSGRQYLRMTVRRGEKGYYWAYRVENVNGCWFSIDEVTVLPIYLSKGR